MLFYGNTFSTKPSTVLCTVWIEMRTAADTIFLFKKFNILLAILVLPELTINTVLAVLKIASLYQNRVNILL